MTSANTLIGKLSSVNIKREDKFPQKLSSNLQCLQGFVVSVTLSNLNDLLVVCVLKKKKKTDPITKQ